MGSIIRVMLIVILAVAVISVSGLTGLEASGRRPLLPAKQATSAAWPRSPLTPAAGTANARQEASSPQANNLRENKSALARRVAEIHARLKELDKLIDEPRSTSSIDDPTKPGYLQSRPELRGLVSEYDHYRSELSALAGSLKAATDDAKQNIGIQGVDACPPLTPINGTLGSGSQDFPASSGLQTGRLLNGLGNVTCGSSNPCSLNTTVGLRSFDAYTFTNTGSTTACVTVAFEMTGCAIGAAMQFSARVGSFDPANPCTNYVGDGGAGFSGEVDQSFSFNVPAGENFVVVVNENDPDGAVGCDYRLTVSGLTCQAICPSSTAFSGILGKGSLDVTTSTTGQQTGRLLNGLGNVTCGSSNPCNLNTAVGSRTFDAYTFINPGAATACVTVDFAMTGCALGTAMQFSARVGSFDPTDPCANYVGDGGAGFSGEADGSFSFNVPAGQIFVVVVNENDPDGAVGCAYSLTISGIDCGPQPACTITCPANITRVNDPNQCGAVVNFPAPTTSGTCGTVSCNPQSGSFFPVGTTTVSCSASAGSSCSFTVAVNDGQPPSITCPSNVTALAPPTCTQSAGAVVSFPAPTASDGCPGVAVACSPASGSTFPVGTTTVTCTATDTGANTATCSFNVSVFNACLQDDSNPGNVTLFNTTTGEYRFCCNGSVVATGVGTVSRKGCEFTLQHTAPDRRVMVKVSFSTGTGSASIQAGPGNIRCTIGDRNILNNSCQCGG